MCYNFYMALSGKDKIMRYLTVLLVLGIFVGGLVIVWPDYMRSRALRRQDAELSRQIELKRQEIAGLIENQRRFRTDADFVETIARKSRRVFPGELVFIFED